MPNIFSLFIVMLYSAAHYYSHKFKFLLSAYSRLAGFDSLVLAFAELGGVELSFSG